MVRRPVRAPLTWRSVRVNLNSATITNGAGTTASLTGAGYQSDRRTLQIDTTAATVTQVVASPGSGTENPGAVITITVDLSKAVTVTGTPTLKLNLMAPPRPIPAALALNALTFSYTVGATDGNGTDLLPLLQVNLMPGGATVKRCGGQTPPICRAAMIDVPGPFDRSATGRRFGFRDAFVGRCGHRIHNHPDARFE